MTTTEWRAIVGSTLVILSCFMLGFSIKYRHEMWTGVKVVQMAKTQATPDTTSDSNEVTVGPLKVEYRWYQPGDSSDDCDKFPMHCNSSGKYQLRDVDNKIWDVQFCEPIPEIRDNSTIMLTYVKTEERCTRFANAKVISEPELPKKDGK